MDTRETTFDKATPIGHPERTGHAALFVPTMGSEGELPPNIKNGAGIVGFGNPNGTLTLYFESNRFNDSTLHMWEDKVLAAFRRMIDHLPTTSKVTITPNHMEQVGVMNADGLRLTKIDSLKRWLAHTNALETAPASAELNWR